MSVAGAEHKMRLARIMRDNRLDAKGKKLAVWNYVITKELESGTQFVLAQPGGQLYAVIGGSNEVLRVPSRGGAAWYGYLHDTYGITEHDSQYAKVLNDAFRHYIQRHGLKAEMRRFAAYDRETHTGYISSYDGRMWKIDGETITNTTNGEDNIFFADDDGGITCCEPEIGPHGLLLDRLTSPNFAPSGLSGITADQQRKALTIWLFALAFPDLLPDKPILLVEGVMGSGKSLSVTLIQLALMGNAEAMILQRNKEDDFGVILLRSPIALFDNTDSFIDWVPDAIAAYTTGGKWNKRKLFTDDENLIIKPHAFISVATRNPASFRRDDVADRCIILRFDRWLSFMPPDTIKQTILANRAALFGEYLWFVGQITKAIREQGGVSIEAESFRMAGFAALGRVIGRVLGWDESAVPEALQALQGERDAFINEDDPLLDLLQKWISYRTKHGPSNVGKLVTSMQLHAELDTFAQAAQIQWKDTPRSLSQKLRSTHIEREFHVESQNLGGQKHYRIWRHTDARLELVPDHGVIPLVGDDG